MVWPPPKAPPSAKIVVPTGGSYVGPGSGGGEGGTYMNPSGEIISAGRGSTVGSSSPSTSGYYGGYEEKGFRNEAIQNEQRSIAQKKLGQIRQVITNNARGERTFIGVNGQKYTFPIDSTKFTAVTPGYRTTLTRGRVVQEQGFFGGITSKESMIPLRSSVGGERSNIRLFQPYEFKAMQQQEFESRMLDALTRQGRIPVTQKQLMEVAFKKQGFKTSVNSARDLIITDKNGFRVYSGENIIGFNEKGERQIIGDLRSYGGPSSAIYRKEFMPLTDREAELNRHNYILLNDALIEEKRKFAEPINKIFRTGDKVLNLIIGKEQTKVLRSIGKPTEKQVEKINSNLEFAARPFKIPINLATSAFKGLINLGQLSSMTPASINNLKNQISSALILSNKIKSAAQEAKSKGKISKSTFNDLKRYYPIYQRASSKLKSSILDTKIYTPTLTWNDLYNIRMSMGERKGQTEVTNIMPILYSKIREKNKAINLKIIRTGVMDYNKKAFDLLNNADTIMALQVFAFISLDSFAGGANLLTTSGKLFSTGSRGLIGFITGYATVTQIAEAIKDPSPENIGAAIFFGLPTGLSMISTLKKLGHSFLPNVKNAKIVNIVLKQKLEGHIILLKEAKKIKNYLAIKRINSEILKIKKAILNLNKIIKDKSVINSRDFNPKIPSKYLKQYQGTIKELYHVAFNSPKIKRLLGKKINELVKQGGKLPKEEEILSRILKKSGEIKQPNKLGNLSSKTKLDKIVIFEFKKWKVIIGGGKALNIQTPFWRRRFTSDIDGKVIGNNARKVLESIAKKVNEYYKENIKSPSLFSYERRFKVFPSKHKGTFKLVDMVTKKTLIELTNAKINEVRYVKNKQGLLISDKISLLKGKANSLSKVERFLRKGKTDIEDVTRLTLGKVKLKDIFKPNAKDIFEVVEVKSGAGLDRKLYKEFFLFTDIEADLAYSKGKKYSILKFKENIGSYSKELRKLIDKASKGMLSKKQSITLRKRLVDYAKKNPKKFLPGTRTLSMTSGEREIINAAMAKFKRIGKFKTFDNDLKKFIEIAYLTRNLKSYVRTPIERFFEFGKDMYKAYNKNTLQRLKLRLTNPDMIQVRKYIKLLKNNINLSKPQKLKVREIINKIFKSKKATYKLTAEEKVFGKVFKDINKLTDLQKQIIRLSDMRRRIIKVNSLDEITRIRVREQPTNRNRIVREIREIIRLPKRITAREIIRNPERAILRAKTPIRDIKRTVAREVRAPIRRGSRTPVRTPIRTPNRITTRTPIRVIRTPNRIRRPIITRPTPRPSTPPPPKYSEDRYIGKKDIVEIAKKKRKFIYLSDLISILYGRVATSSQVRALKQVGRLFTGLEARPVIA